MTPSQVLRKAARILRRRGWCRNTFGKNGRLCALGAINVAAGFPHNDWEVCMTASLAGRAAQKLRRSVGVLQLSMWNDDPKRTGREVVAAMQRAGKARRRPVSVTESKDGQGEEI